MLLLAAVLAPALFAAGKAFLRLASDHGWADSRWIGWIVQAAEKTEFPGYFDRAALLVGVAGLWPLFRLLRMTRAETVGLETAGAGFKHGAWGFVLATGGLAVLGVAFGWLDVSRVVKHPPWGRIATPLISGLCVACLEEFLFRGAMLGVLRRSLRPRAAMTVATFLFAGLHFLKPPAHGTFADASVTWTSGFQVLTRLFDGFGEWQHVVAEFLLLFAVGWVLVGARMATGGLGLGIGLHAGWVAAMKHLSQVTVPTAALRRGEFFPWVTENHCKAIVGSYVGLAPVAIILLTGALALRICKPGRRA